MPDWLVDLVRDCVVAPGPLPSPSVVAGRTVVAIVFGFLVAAVYRLALGRRPEGNTLSTTLVLLTVLIALVTMVIGESQARAFGLVGALSIIRFRTVVEDTRDTAFVIFSVVVGMAAGAGYGVLAAVGVPAVALAAIAMARLDRPRHSTGGPAVRLVVRLGLGHEPDATLGPLLAQHLTAVRLIGTSTARQGATFDLTYTGQLRQPGATFPLVNQLNHTDGVQSVELREI